MGERGTVNLDRDAALAIQQRGLRDFIGVLAVSAPGSRLIELDGGVTGAIVPAAAERSIVNSVTYRDPAALVDSLDELAAAYADAGVRAWTVWTPEHDSEAIAGLRAAGHALDGAPLAMVLDLAEHDAAPDDELSWDRDLDLELLGALNDAAYGLASNGGIAAALRHRPDDAGLRLYRALVEGETACVVATIDHDPSAGAAGPDCGIYFVAVPPRFRGRRLAGRLMDVALAEARERGCAISSLQASAMGEPTYRAMGYRPCFRLQLHEHRVASGGDGS